MFVERISTHITSKTSSLPSRRFTFSAVMLILSLKLFLSHTHTHTASSCPQPTMVVSPHNQTPVRGIANISRYVCRLFCPELYEGSGHQQSALVDSWLDAVTGTYIFGSSKEKLSVLRRLNSHLGSCQFLAGDDVTLADVVAYAIICGGPGGQKLTDNVKKWINCCRSRPEFQGVPTVNLTSS